MSQKVLMIAYHFPPVAASSGFLRTLKFAQHLSGYGVEPTVLTVKPSAYEQMNPDNYKLLDDLKGLSAAVVPQRMGREISPGEVNILAYWHFLTVGRAGFLLVFLLDCVK